MCQLKLHFSSVTIEPRHELVACTSDDWRAIHTDLIEMYYLSRRIDTSEPLIIEFGFSLRIAVDSVRYKSQNNHI